MYMHLQGSLEEVKRQTGLGYYVKIKKQDWGKQVNFCEIIHFCRRKISLFPEKLQFHGHQSLWISRFCVYVHVH